MNQKVTKIIRILLGSMLVIFGANKFIMLVFLFCMNRNKFSPLFNA